MEAQASWLEFELLNIHNSYTKTNQIKQENENIIVTV